MDNEATTMESLISENSFDMTTPMMNTDLISHSSVFGSMGSPIGLRDPFVDDEDIFINTGTVSVSNVECASLSTRLRRRKASQPQRVLYPDSPSAPSSSPSNINVTAEEKPQACPSEGLFKCPSCDARYNDKSDLRAHQKSVHAPKDGNSKECEICGVVVLNASSLRNHRKRVHEKTERTFQCNMCSKKFFSKTELTQHSFVHADEKNFKCDHCGKRFASRAYLERHSKTHQGVKPFQCEICNKQLGDKTGFLAHVRAHKGEKPHQCNICLKRYTIKRHLTAHMRTHSSSRPFVCESPGCNKTFRSRSTLRMHKDFHAGVKRWSCSICERSFFSQGNMAKHVRRHGGKKKFSCEVCGKDFFEKQELKSHQRVHLSSNVSEINLDEIPSVTDILLPDVILDNSDESQFRQASGASSSADTCTGEMVIMVDGQACSVLESQNHASIPLYRNTAFAFASEFGAENLMNDPNKLQNAMHLNYHFQDQPLYNCTLCSYTFPAESSLRDHLIDYHRVEAEKIH